MNPLILKVWGKRHFADVRKMIEIGQRLVSKEEAIAIVDAWLIAEFKGGRHRVRIDKIDK